MQIHELDNYQGVSSEDVYLAVDDGTETQKVPMTDVGVTTEMTLAEAQAGSVEEPRVITPAVLNQFVESMHPVGSLYTTSTNTNPGTSLGFGTWELIDKRFKYAWITSGFTWDTTNTQSGAFACVLRGNAIEFRFTWANKTNLSDTTQTLGTLDLTAVGVNAVQHNCFLLAQCDGLNAIGCLEFTLGQATAVLRSSDWVTRAATIPAGTNSNCQAQYTLLVQNCSGMIDSFCDQFIWKRTA